MDGEESFVALMHCYGKIQKSKRHGVKFMDRELLSIFIRSSSTLAEIKHNILQKLGVCRTKWVKKLFYKISIANVKYETFVIGSDEDMQVLFHCQWIFPDVRIPELLAKLEDGVESSGSSAPNPQSTRMGGALTSMTVVAPSGPIPDPPRVGAGTDGMPHGVPDFEVEAGPNRVENAMRDDDSDDEPVDIGGDSDDDIPSNSHTPHGASGSGTEQYLPHLSTLNLEAVGQQRNVEATFTRQGLHDATALTEFQIGQSFQNKEEVVLSVKDYNIWRGVAYSLMESEHLKYHEICKEFGKWCM
ncbi:uncharacterized protein LOC107492424 [Arachis duranensis]|uniref:Uncharacterized protein LOC107492424 n=1 Tax=Arachis duranensis TaxID=130453 RepID=A0A6P4DP80_ARADU|nr:uncharacterized protein LOC107492424 [Arachis duranensis]